jgi:hypothetical protein
MTGPDEDDSLACVVCTMLAISVILARVVCSPVAISVSSSEYVFFRGRQGNPAFEIRAGNPAIRQFGPRIKVR